MKKRELLYGLILILTGTFIHAQDPHFSQFNENPSLINPALTGANNPMRASLNFRDQWRSVTTSYQTYGASFETRLKPGSWQKVDQFRSMTFKERSVGRLAFGFSIYRDKAGDGNLSHTQGNFSIASFVPTGRNSFLSVGLQASLVQTQLNTSKLIFPDQYNGTGYSQSVSTKENFGSTNFVYPDLAGGILWSFNRSDKKISGIKQKKASLGFSAYHVNRPKQKYLSTGQEKISMKYVFHGDFLIDFYSSDWAIAPSFLVQLQGASTELLAGALLKYYTNIDSKYTGIIKRSSIGFGAYYRSNDAAIVSVLMEWKEQYCVGLSYDINISRLTAASSARGGMEISLRYTPPSAFLYQMKNKPVEPSEK